MTTISNSTTAGITLSSPSDVNPIVVNPGVSVSGIGTAIYAPGGSWTIQNSGTISSAEAIDLRTGGSVTNAAVGSIKGTLVGVAIYGSAGTVVNSGGISGTTTSLGRGVYLGAGGSVTNAASASIRGGSGTGTTAIGVDLGAAGSVTNAVSASIKGDHFGVYIVGGTGTVLNSGSIAAPATNGLGVYLHSGGSVTNAASASITGGNFGVALYGGGSVTNAAAASIKSNIAVLIFDGAGTVANSGTITGSSGGGVFLLSGGSVTNAAASAEIIGAQYGVRIASSAGTVVNSG